MLYICTTILAVTLTIDGGIDNCSGLSGPSLYRLQLTSPKIQTLVDGIRSIARQEEPIGQVALVFLAVSRNISLSLVISSSQVFFTSP